MALTNHEVKHKTIEISTIKNQGENTANNSYRKKTSVPSKLSWIKHIEKQQ